MNFRIDGSLAIAALAVMLLLAGCAKEVSPPVVAVSADESGEIIGGEEVDFDDPISRTTVAIYDSTKIGTCTGSIVGRNLILTAAHCVEARPKELLVIFGPDVKSDDMAAREVIDYIIPEFRDERRKQKIDTGDIALLKFKGNLPRGFRSVPLLKDTQRLRDGASAVLAGYGIIDGVRRGLKGKNDPNGVGRLRRVNVSIKMARFGKTEVLMDQTQGRGACHGDSGGPAFLKVDDEFHLFAITSRGVNDPRDTCGQYAAFTGILPYMKWLKSAARELNERKTPNDNVAPQVPLHIGRDNRPLIGL